MILRIDGCRKNKSSFFSKIDTESERWSIFLSRYCLRHLDASIDRQDRARAQCATSWTEKKEHREHARRVCVAFFSLALSFSFFPLSTTFFFFFDVGSLLAHLLSSTSSPLLKK